MTVKIKDIQADKICRDCSLVKLIGEFTKWTHKNGHSYIKSYCKSCESNRTSKYQKKRGSEWRLEHTRKYRKTDLGKLAIKRKTVKFRESYPEKYKAYNKVQTAIRNGSLIKKPCERCGNEKVHAHHEDYSKPIDILWLCAKCHVKHHLQTAGAY